MEHSKRPLFTLRAFAVANFMFVASGLFFLGFAALAVRTKAVGNTSTAPYFAGTTNQACSVIPSGP